MRLREFRTSKLFGIFDHVVPVNLEDRITIVHGPNGFGKTAILRLIAGLFQGRFSALRQLPFESIACAFDNNSTLTVTRKIRPAAKESDGGVDLSFHYPPQPPYCLKPVGTADFPLAMIDDVVPGLRRIGPTQWLHQSTGEVLSVEDVLDAYSDHLPVRHHEGRRIPAWLQDLIESVPVHYVQAHRLQTIEPVSGPRSSRDRQRRSVVAVAEYSEQLAGQIQAALAKYAELSQSLDRSFPSRLIQGAASAASKPDISRRLAALEDKRTQLTAVGLLDREEHQHIPITQEIDNSKLGVLSVYVKDAEQKLGVFDSIFERINLFQAIVNRRFQFKTMSISKQHGFVFTTSKKQPLPPTGLSTGEQHEVVLLYELLFRVPPNSLVLIDEPEISLHIAWQEQFLPDLEQITGISNFDVLIATHSPQIIGNRWDLTVALEAPK